ncbi:glycyl-tRNA synthetase beta subunit [Enterococcus rivorum]|nr:glycyl-tRNA synthetase beta subunit [Enterococcus rivorum]
MQVRQHIFWKEPNEEEIFSFLSRRLPQLLEQKWYADIKEIKEQKRVNPKRMQRMLRIARQKLVLSTKSQQAISQQRDKLKTIKNKRNKEGKQQFMEEQFKKKQEKRR